MFYSVGCSVNKYLPLCPHAALHICFPPSSDPLRVSISAPRAQLCHLDCHLALCTPRCGSGALLNMASAGLLIHRAFLPQQKGDHIENSVINASNKHSLPSCLKEDEATNCLCYMHSASASSILQCCCNIRLVIVPHRLSLFMGVSC